MDDFKERLLAEKEELSERIGRLNTALQKEGFDKKVGEFQAAMLTVQHNAMITYLECLNLRIKNLNR